MFLDLLGIYDPEDHRSADHDIPSMGPRPQESGSCDIAGTPMTCPGHTLDGVADHGQGPSQSGHFRCPKQSKIDDFRPPDLVVQTTRSVDTKSTKTRNVKTC